MFPPGFIASIIPSTRYRRITHHLDGKDKGKAYIHSPNREAIFKSCAPVGDLTPFAWTSSCRITDRCNEYYQCIKMAGETASHIGLANVEEHLAMLVSASLVDSLVAWWGSEE